MSFSALRSLLFRHAKQPFAARIIYVRTFKDHEKQMRRDLYRRRLAQGPEPERPASAWVNWNYDMELFCFGKRLHEEFPEEPLKQAFINSSYVEGERRKREELGVDEEDQMQLKDNQELAEHGARVIIRSLTSFFTSSLPYLPPPAIQAIVSHLTSSSLLCHVAQHLGVKDLVLTHEFPPSEETMATTLKAVVGVLHKHQGEERAALFVKDLIGTQMVGKRIDDVWVPDDVMKQLTHELQKRNMPEPEPRLLWSSGANTILSNYEVAIYCDKQLIGQSSGESITVAEEMAARDALRNIYRIQDHHAPLKF